MKKLFRLFPARPINEQTDFARKRLQRSMPGEVGAMNSIRLGGMSL